MPACEATVACYLSDSWWDRALIDEQVQARGLVDAKIGEPDHGPQEDFGDVIRRAGPASWGSVE